MTTLWQDLRYGVRMLWKNPGFSLIAVCTLALGIGANAAIFSVVNGVLLRPLPYPQADQLVRIWSADQKTGQRFLETSYQDFQQFKQPARAFAAMAAFSEAPRILRDDKHEPGSITVARVSEGFFPVFGISPGLLLARGLAREQEMAIRTALGAGRGRIVRQLLTESILIATLGGALGLLFGVWALEAIVLLSPDNIPRLNEVVLDGRVMAVMIAVTTLAGIIFGLVPALQASQLDPHNMLKSGGRGATGSRSKHRLRQGLVIAEVALATVLVIGAGLLLKSFGRLVSFDHGFQAENVLVVPLPLRGQIDPQFAAFYEQVLEQVRALPTVESASLALRTPMEAQSLRLPFQIEGQPALPEQELPRITLRPITSDYFKTVAIPLVSGRAFNEQDCAGGPAVAIVNQTFVKTFFPQSEPIGRRLQSGSRKGQSISIIGVAADVLPEAGTASRPAIYRPFIQFPVPGVSLLVRTAGNPLGLVSAIRERIRALNPNAPLDKIYPLEQKVSEATISPRFTMLLVGLFAALGMMLAAVGIYGVMSYAVAERAKEIGIRMALGAERFAVLQLILAQGMKLTLLGVGSGLGAALGLTHLMKTLLFGVSATDPLTFAVIALLLALVALLACWLPARRATKVDPMIALRCE